MNNKIYYLYVIKCDQYIKVGVTTDMCSRLNSIYQVNPFELNVLRQIPYNNKVYVFFAERLIHEQLRSINKNVRGEWFIYDEESISLIDQLSIDFSNEYIAKKYIQYQ